ncbi:NADH-quinone oxidoreductase subunit C [Paenibacillus sp. y28]|uniref:NADH-quinone oxidoreductase subunit C n=1 Tax=Paenibacillus sp. y28 TaxID=3129110 RepID=UPI00301A7B5D
MSEEEKKEKAEDQPNAADVEETSTEAQRETVKEAVTSEPAAGSADADKEAKAKAAAEARAARAAARAKQSEPGGEEEAAPKGPSPSQPKLDRLVAILKEQAGEEAVDEAYINERNGHIPTVVIKPAYWLQSAQTLRNHPELMLDYLRNMTGADMETHLETVYHLIQFKAKQNYAVRVKTDREAPQIPSVTPVWATADWNEREIYDLLGIDFPGHPNLTRIMMSDDWIGHPLRKDYEPYDPEV